jgi:hypothetical protein
MINLFFAQSLSTSTQTLVQLQTGQAEVRRVLEEQHKVALAKVAENATTIKGLRMMTIITLLLVRQD